MPEDLEIRRGLVIPGEELREAASRSGGPGGQHVNKTETKVTLIFDLDGSTALDEGQKALLRAQLATRISKSGQLRMASQRHRSQKANRDATIERFVDLVGAALTPQRERRTTRVPRRVKRQRLEEKRRTAEKKRQRREVDWS